MIINNIKYIEYIDAKASTKDLEDNFWDSEILEFIQMVF